MTSTAFSLTNAWTPANAFTAPQDGEVLLSNASADNLRWVRGAGSTAPAIAPGQAYLLRPGRSQTVPLAAGQTLWLAGRPGGGAAVDLFPNGQAAPTSRADLAAQLAGGLSRPDGETIAAGGQNYTWTAAAVAIPDLPGLLPATQIVTLEQFGATGDGATDDTAAWVAANDYLELLGGGIIQGGNGAAYALRETTIANNVQFVGQGPDRTTLAVHPNITPGAAFLTNRNISGGGVRVARNVAIRDCALDGAALPFDRWLSRADGAPITDPEADYVMGSGALAAGLSGVSLTAHLTGDAVSAVTINNGGAGWNGHPTHPYQATTVPLKFTGGGGAGAVAYATISGGTLTSVTLDQGGRGYISAPLVEPMGGYADIALLTDPAVDRRNPAYAQAGDGLRLAKIDAPVVERVHFRNFRGIALVDAGCRNARLAQLSFENCGKNDGAFPCIWVQSYGAPAQGDPWFADTENCLIEDVQVTGAERSAVLWAPTRGGAIRRLRAQGCGESTIFIGANIHHGGGHSLIEDCDLSGNVLTDIAGQLIEAGGAQDLLIQGCRLTGSALGPLNVNGARRVTVRDCVFTDNVTAASTLAGRKPFGPFSERFAFQPGQRPEAGEEILPETVPNIEIGSLGSAGCASVRFVNNLFVETRAAHPPALMKQVKSGVDDIAQDVVIEDNDLTGLPAGMALLDTGVGGVFVPTMPLHIRRNLGHASEAPVILSHSFTATGLQLFTPGFRPARVEIFASVVGGAQLRGSQGAFSWTRSGLRNDFAQVFSSDGAAVYGAFVSPEVLRTTDPATAAVTCSVEFAAWTETGFYLNCVANAEPVAVHMICHP